jgi:hypothetical protein
MASGVGPLRTNCSDSDYPLTTGGSSCRWTRKHWSKNCQCKKLWCETIPKRSIVAPRLRLKWARISWSAHITTKILRSDRWTFVNYAIFLNSLNLHCHFGSVRRTWSFIRSAVNRFLSWKRLHGLLGASPNVLFGFGDTHTVAPEPVASIRQSDCNRCVAR